MMKARVMAQFATLLCFVGYMGLEKGWENLDFRIAPLYQDVKKWEAEQDNQERGAETK
jgi:hypothetical protein